MLPECLPGKVHRFYRSAEPCDRTFCGPHVVYYCDCCQFVADEVDDSDWCGEILRLDPCCDAHMPPGTLGQCALSKVHGCEECCGLCPDYGFEED